MLKKKKYKHQGYSPLKLKSPAKEHGSGEIDDVEANRPIFRGFIGGDSFCTKQGYRGLRIHSMWVQNIFDSFLTDDPELASIALQSQLASLKDVVTGGYQGSPFSIGDFGFYSDNQFDLQAQYLREDERQKSKGHNYLSEKEWETVDEKISALARHGTARFLKATRGDSFASIAIRQNAFKVAKVFMDAGIDPLIANEEGVDMFETVKQQYNFLVKELKAVQEFKQEAGSKVLVPSYIDSMLSKEEQTLQSFDNLSKFADAVDANLQGRLKQIEVDAVLQRRCMLRNIEFPADKAWNITQKEKVERYIKETAELKHYISEKLRQHQTYSSQFDNLADVLRSNIDMIFPDSTAIALAGVSSKKYFGEDGELQVPLALTICKVAAVAVAQASGDARRHSHGLGQGQVLATGDEHSDAVSVLSSSTRCESLDVADATSGGVGVVGGGVKLPAIHGGIRPGTGASTGELVPIPEQQDGEGEGAIRSGEGSFRGTPVRLGSQGRVDSLSSSPSHAGGAGGTGPSFRTPDRSGGGGGGEGGGGSAVSRQDSWRSVQSAQSMQSTGSRRGRGNSMGALGSRSSSKYSMLNNDHETVATANSTAGASSVLTPLRGDTAHSDRGEGSEFGGRGGSEPGNHSAYLFGASTPAPLLHSKQELYDKLGITDAISLEQANSITGSSGNRRNRNKASSSRQGGASAASPAGGSGSGVGTGVSPVKKKVDYLPIIGTLKESEHEVIMYR